MHWLNFSTEWNRSSAHWTLRVWQTDGETPYWTDLRKYLTRPQRREARPFTAYVSIGAEGFGV